MNEADAIYLGEQMCVRVCLTATSHGRIPWYIFKAWIAWFKAHGSTVLPVPGSSELTYFFFKLRPVTMSKAQCFAALCVLELYHNFNFSLVLRRTAPTNFMKVFRFCASSPNKLYSLPALSRALRETHTLAEFAVSRFHDNLSHKVKTRANFSSAEKEMQIFLNVAVQAP